VQTPPLDPDVADTAPSDSLLTAYDEEHLVTGRKMHALQLTLVAI
jgi:hypothetical protein